MRSSTAYITVTCDCCGYDEEVELTATARGGYDERHVDGRLRSYGWSTVDRDICPDCRAEESSGEEAGE